MNKQVSRKWLIMILIVSVVFISAGFVHNRRQFSQLKYYEYQYKHPEITYLNRYYHFTELMRDPGIQGKLLRYESDYDRTLQSVFILKPSEEEPEKLFYFFHGMDGDCGDGVVVRDLVIKFNAVVVTMGSRGASWLSDELLADAEQIINKYTENIEGFYLIGISMGGTQVLSLAGLLPEKIRQSILGVIALIPGSNLPAIAGQSSSQRVKDTLMSSVDGDFTILQQRSPNQLIDQYREKLPFVIFYNEKDSVLVARDLEIFINELRNNHPVSVFSAPGDHNFTYKDFNYKIVFDSLGRNSSTRMALPLL